MPRIGGPTSKQRRKPRGVEIDDMQFSRMNDTRISTVSNRSAHLQSAKTVETSWASTPVVTANADAATIQLPTPLDRYDVPNETAASTSKHQQRAPRRLQKARNAPNKIPDDRCPAPPGLGGIAAPI